MHMPGYPCPPLPSRWSGTWGPIVPRSSPAPSMDGGQGHSRDLGAPHPCRYSYCTYLPMIPFEPYFSTSVLARPGSKELSASSFPGHASPADRGLRSRSWLPLSPAVWGPGLVSELSARSAFTAGSAPVCDNLIRSPWGHRRPIRFQNDTARCSELSIRLVTEARQLHEITA